MEFETIQNVEYLIHISLQMSETERTEEDFENLAQQGNQCVVYLTENIQNQNHTVRTMIKIVAIMFKLRELQFRNIFFDYALREFQTNRFDVHAIQAKIVRILGIFTTASSLLEESYLQIPDLLDELTSNLILQQTRFSQLRHRYRNIMFSSETKVPTGPTGPTGPNSLRF